MIKIKKKKKKNFQSKRIKNDASKPEVNSVDILWTDPKACEQCEMM